MDDHLGLRVGELVVIGIPEGVLTRAAVLAYLLPPAALVLAAGSAGSLGAGDLGSAFAGVLGLVLGLLATRADDRRHGRAAAATARSWCVGT